jgi:hypothetical protein
MKFLPLLLLAVYSAAPVRSQTTAPDATGARVSAAMKRPSVVRPALRRPESDKKTGKQRFSTAQRMAVMNNPPPLKVLPDFNVSDRDGHMVTAKTLQRANHWLLIYRTENCIPCDRLMNVLAASESSGLKSGQPYVVLVAESKSDALEKVRANYSALRDATWMSDKNGQALVALKPRGAPIVYAMEGNKIIWSVPGNLGDPARVEKMAASWMTSTSAINGGSPAAASTATTQ